ncbi:MAG: Ig-like domain-containing protein [Gemmatimonadales bacterium]
MRSRVRSLRRLALVAAGLTFTACQTATSPGGGNNNNNNPPAVSSVSVSSPSSTVDVGSTVQLSVTVSPSGAAQGVTWSSSDPSKATVSSNGLVTALLPGSVQITATSTSDATKSGSVSLTLTGCVPLASGDISSGATLMANVCYRINSALTVSGGTLTVPAGGRIEFGPNAGLRIMNAGRLNAVGTAAQPIVFTSADPVDHWRGLEFESSRGSANMLHYVMLENPGSDGWSGATYSQAGIFLNGNSLVDIQNSTIENSDGTGITVLEDAEMTFLNNTLKDNAVAAWVHPNVVRYVDRTTIFTGNAENLVRVAFGNTDKVSTAQTWQLLGVHYEVQTRMFIQAPLTIEAGVRLEMLTDVSLIVDQGGAIKAIGTAGQPIFFVSREPIPGTWVGIKIATASLDNQFDYVRLGYGGSQPWTGGNESRATVYLEGNSKIVITNSLFFTSGYYGLWVPSGGNIAGFDGNTFSENVRVAIVHPNRVGQITANNTFSNNTENKVRVTFGNNDAVVAAQTWRALTVPYYVNTRTFIEAPLTIEAGTTVEFAQDANLVVTTGGSLKADGTPTAQVTFRGGQDLIGYWKGIEYNTASVDNVLDNVVFRNAGSDQWFGGASSISSLLVNSNGTLSLTNSSFAQTAGYAGIVRNGGTLACSGVNDNGYGFFVYTNSGSSLQLNYCP